MNDRPTPQEILMMGKYWGIARRNLCARSTRTRSTQINQIMTNCVMSKSHGARFQKVDGKALSEHSPFSAVLFSFNTLDFFIEKRFRFSWFKISASYLFLNSFLPSKKSPSVFCKCISIYSKKTHKPRPKTHRITISVKKPQLINPTHCGIKLALTKQFEGTQFEWSKNFSVSYWL